ncbi:hypothetical protein BI364_10360 [Acidihalobacter yilgarnensis]|uniref:CopG family transcriptional regulator n=1 Tax=Acidihalobacter yilgarnensis TaxID=2819280 RepID=A0A1D8IPE5_9GAMM|nr:hypothetical protein [Acidihalobacter yilgarnensis]AOU98309.1 hypothetical protein BI364_10360 [Acidihalobacter yilgarnensis]
MKNQNVAFRVPAAIYDEVCSRAEADRQTLADWLRRAVRNEIERQQEGDRLAAMEARLEAQIADLSALIRRLAVED